MDSMPPACRLLESPAAANRRWRAGISPSLSGRGLWYASFGQHARVAIWRAVVSGLRLREVNDGWVCDDAIAPDRLTLVEADVSPQDAGAWLGDQQRSPERRRSQGPVCNRPRLLAF